MTDPDGTKLKLIEAAARVFAERGFQKASTREICRLAEANVAAVNYHFGGKAELYREVFRRSLRDFIDRGALPQGRGLPARRVLAHYYRQMLEPLRSSETSCRLYQLHAREQLEPSGVLGDLRAQALRRHFELLSGLVRREMGLKSLDLEGWRLVFALEGAMMLYWQKGCEVRDFAPGLFSGKSWVEDLSERLADFGAALVQAERRRRHSGKAGRARA